MHFLKEEKYEEHYIFIFYLKTVFIPKVVNNQKNNIDSNNICIP